MTRKTKRPSRDRDGGKPGKPRRHGARAETLDVRHVLRLFREAKKPLSAREIVQALHIDRRDTDALASALADLTAQGRIIQMRDAFGLPDRMQLVTGRLQVTKGGNGFLLPDDPRRKDVFIPSRDLLGAWHGDRVAVAITRDRPGRGHEGRVARIIERGRKTLTAKVMRGVGEGAWLCRPTDPLLEFGVMCSAVPGLSPAPGQIVAVAPGEQLEVRLWEGVIQAVLGPEGEVEVQEALVKANHDIPTRFSKEALAQAEALPRDPDESDFAGRRDLRGLPLVTIDGATARDFDDAVCVEEGPQGFTLWVAVADVAHYARPGSALDEEARERGNSYYFPRSVEPMFPERLSNGLCSLNPDVPRLAMAVRQEFSRHGAPGEYEVFCAVMQSHARLTYDQVKAAVLDREPAERKRVAHVLPMLERAERLARLMRERRMRRGSLDFDLPEPEVLFDDAGGPLDIRPRERHFAHQIIEEFMIAANEAVASMLENSGLPCLYRVHPDPDPDKLAALFKLLSRTDPGRAPRRSGKGRAPAPGEFTPQALQELLASVAGSDKEFLVNRLLLRSMKQARYSPANEGHFGLASECYCHFTSPIRRYADLVVHRLAKRAVGQGAGKDTPVPSFKPLQKLAQHLSARERSAMEAEREIHKRLTCLVLRDREGEAFTGVVSGLSDFGFWVELKEVMAEGLVRLSSLSDDYYHYHSDREMLLGQRTGRMIRLGQSVAVRLDQVSLDRLEITLTMDR